MLKFTGHQLFKIQHYQTSSLRKQRFQFLTWNGWKIYDNVLLPIRGGCWPHLNPWWQTNKLVPTLPRLPLLFCGFSYSECQPLQSFLLKPYFSCYYFFTMRCLLRWVFCFGTCCSVYAEFYMPPAVQNWALPSKPPDNSFNSLLPTKIYCCLSGMVPGIIVTFDAVNRIPIALNWTVVFL